MGLEQTWRWYGPEDPVSLANIKMAGATGTVTALHHIPNGEVWPIDEIYARKKQVEDACLTWSVVESVPVHEDIKKRTGNFKKYIKNYKQSIRNLSECGIDTVCYNFMPVLDWTRTDLAYRMPDRSLALRFDRAKFAAFELFILKRHGAEKDYSITEITRAKQAFDNMDAAAKEKLANNIIAGLPGAEEGYSLEQFQSALDCYVDIDDKALRTNLYAFIKEIAPVAEEAEVFLAIHPDDPPFPVLGLPRVVATAQDLEFFLTRVSSRANGLCFCTGSLGSRADNDILELFQKWADRVHFLHLRNTKVKADGSFMEVAHLEGDTDMRDLMHQIVSAMQEQQRSIPMRPDHGVKMSHEAHISTYPGYTFAGRAKGLAELRGLELGCQG